MGFNCGIIGLPNVGKSTLFNAITAAGADASNYPFCTIEPNVGIVNVPDTRIDVLAAAYHPSRVTPTTIEFVDVAGLVKGASRGEGLGNQFLGHIREVDAIAHVVRCFDDPNVVHVHGEVNPRRDIEVVETELLLKDLETVEKKSAEAHKRAKSGDKKVKAETEFLTRVRDHLNAGRFVRSLLAQNDDESRWLREMHLLSGKAVMYVCNVPEKDLTGESECVRVVREIAAGVSARTVRICASIEAEIATLPAAERGNFMRDLGLSESGLSQVIREGYDLLHLLTFFTVGSKEVRAWTLPRGATAIDAAGVIHTDFAKGFIRAEVMKFEDFSRLGSEQAVKDAGVLRLEGKEYQVRDGDIVHFRFNV